MNFLAKIWGQGEGYRCVVSGKGMAHKFYTFEKGFQVPQNKDVWFAPSLLNKSERKIESVISTKAFWLDIDCGQGKAYESQTTAAFALKEFTDNLDLPYPAVISSGNGLHVYWILEKPITPNKWSPIAKALRDACIDLNLKADHGITIDIARILRVPGTKNYKDPKNPKPVEILSENPECTYEEIEEALGSYILKAELAEAAKETNKNFGIEFQQTPKDANSIADRCAQMARLRDTKGNIPEPEWYAGLGVLALCTDGVLLADQWSQGHPKYSKRATERKFERAKAFAPTTCQKFYEVNPDLCKACPYWQKISSPVQLGETVTPLEPITLKTENTEVATKTSLEPITIVPKPYLCGKEGVFLYKPATDTEGPEKQFIASHPIWVSRVMVGEDGSGSEIELSWINAEGKNRSANIRQSLIETPAAFGGELRDRNIHFYGNLREFIYYISRCIDHVTRKQKEETVYNKFGFTDNNAGFLIGREFITKDGIKPAHISSCISVKRVEQMSARGSLDKWKKAGKYLDRPQYWPHRFAILACLGAPLFHVSGNEGSILSLAGETSGGKTTAANVGIAAFADPRAFTIDPTSTIRAFYEHWRQACNLPLVINEAGTSIRRDSLQNIILAAANGKARDTLTQAREMHDSGTWDTLTIFTSNTQLLEMPESVIAEASRRRILEIPFLPENCLPLSVGRPINALIEKNHGYAGREFLKAVLADMDYVGNLVNERVEKLQDGIHSVHRYNLWTIGCASVAAEICEGLGLIDFETADCFEHVINILKNSVKENLSPNDQIEAVIEEYLNEFADSIGLKENKGKDAWINDIIRGTPHGRIDYAQGKRESLSLPVRQFKEYVLAKNIDLNRVRKYMRDRSAKTKQVRLSKIGNGIDCWVLPYEEKE